MKFVLKNQLKTTGDIEDTIQRFNIFLSFGVQGGDCYKSVNKYKQSSRNVMWFLYMLSIQLGKNMTM
jgi:hypothetical protein